MCVEWGICPDGFELRIKKHSRTKLCYEFEIVLGISAILPTEKTHIPERSLIEHVCIEIYETVTLNTCWPSIIDQSYTNGIA